MSQLQNTFPRTGALTPSLPRRRYELVVAGIAAAALLSVAIAVSVVRSAPFGATDIGPVSDGFLHGRSALTIRIIPGPVDPTTVTDGWMSRYLPSATAGEVTDGWMSRYLPSATAGKVTDGWMSRYLPSASGGDR